MRLTHWLQRAPAAAVALGALLVTFGAAHADEGHTHGEGAVSYDLGLLLFGVVCLVGIFITLMGSKSFLLARLAVRQAAAGDRIGLVAAMRQFSRNAKLFLAYSLMAELGGGIWSVIFNLYLLRVGFPVTFIGTFWLVNMLCHGVAALPAGLIADRFGRRRAFFIATGVSLLAQGSLLFTLDPSAILVLAGVAGFGEAFHGVTGAPFMMENSEPQERPHLFSLNASFLQASRFVGSVTGGFLPVVWALTVGLPAVDPTAVRWALVTGLPLTAVALIPLAFMHERAPQHVASVKDFVMLRNIVNLDVIVKLAGLSVLTGVAFGMTIRFFNVFFEQSYKASDGEIGTVLGLGSIAGAGAILLSPVLAQTFGKARSVFISQAASLPFLLLMAAAPSLQFATGFFLLRGTLYSLAQPLRNQLNMEFVGPQERGTTAGFTHTAFDLGGGLGAWIFAAILGDGGFASAFLTAAVLILVPAVLYYKFFDGMERNARAEQLAPAEGVPA